jgi:ABC-type transporter Mla subunit MlaD
MSISRWTLFNLFCCCLLAGACWAQHHHDDVLNPDEIDQIRDAAQTPDDRLKLYIQFARARLDALDKSRTDPAVKDHAQEIHDRLSDFVDIYDELDENVDTYADRKDDLRKPLKAVIDADTEFQTLLRALQSSLTGAQNQEVYQFFLTTALNAVDDGARDHRQLLAEQEEAAKHRKKREKGVDEQ